MPSILRFPSLSSALTSTAPVSAPRVVPTPGLETVLGLHAAVQSQKRALGGDGALTASALFGIPTSQDREALCDWLTGVGCYHLLGQLEACGVKTLADATMLTNVRLLYGSSFLPWRCCD